MSFNNDKNIYRLFLWDWCPSCGAHIICPNCGNNTCNASFGNDDGTGVRESRKPDGTEKDKCQVCNLAYQYCHLAYKLNAQPKNKREINALNKKLMKNKGQDV